MFRLSVFFAVFVLMLCIPMSAKAGNATVFPPADCSSEEVRVITWKDGSTTTYCATGQEVFALALPNCKEGEVIVFHEGDSGRIPISRQIVMKGKFVCEKIPGLPECEAGQFPVFDGKQYVCGTLPVCKANEVLSANEDGLICVPKDAKDKLPVCKPDEVLSTDVSGYICVPAKSNADPGTLCGLAYVTTPEGSGCNGGVDCCRPVIPCKGYNVCSSCPAGYSFSNPPPYYVSAVITTCVKQ